MLTWNEAYVRSLLPICSSTTPAFKPFRTSPFCSRHMRLAVASPAGPDTLRYYSMDEDSCWAAKDQAGDSWGVVCHCKQSCRELAPPHMHVTVHVTLSG